MGPFVCSQNGQKPTKRLYVMSGVQILVPGAHLFASARSKAAIAPQGMRAFVAFEVAIGCLSLGNDLL